MSCARGVDDAVVYDPRNTSVGGTHAIFLVRGDVTDYNLPRHPEVPTVRLREAWQSAGLAAAILVAMTWLAL